MSSNNSSGIDQAIYLIAKELVSYAKSRGGQISPGGGLKLSIALSLLKWIEKEYGIEGLSEIIEKGLEFSHNEISIGETVTMKNIEKITIGLIQKFEVTNQALRGIPVIPPPDLSSSSNKNKSGGIINKMKRFIGK